MAYSTQVNIEDAITTAKAAQLTDDSGGLTVDATVITNAIAWADDKINGYLRAQHTVPITPVPNLVKQMSIDLTVYRLYTRRLGDDLPETITEQKKDAITQLKDINRGSLKLSDSTSFAGTAGVYAGSKVSTDEIYTDDTLDEYFDADDM